MPKWFWLAVAIVVGLSLKTVTVTYASQSVVNFDEPIGNYNINICNGSPVLLSGTLHVQIKTNSNGSVEARFNTEDTKGIGFDGNRYVYGFHEFATENGTTFTNSYREHLVSMGPDPNETFIATFVVTPTGFTTSFSVECHGAN